MSKYCCAWRHTAAAVGLICAVVPLYSVAARGVPLRSVAGNVVPRSSTCGTRWRVIPRGNRYAVRALAAQGTLVMAATDAGLLRSDDGGQSWSAAPPTGPAHNRPSATTIGNLVALAMATAGPGRVYAVTAAGQVLRGDARTCAWTVRGSLPGTQFGAGMAFAVSLINPGILLAACMNAHDVCRSDDGGATWHDVLHPPRDPHNWSTFSLLTWANGAVYAGGWWQPGVYRSLDGGRTWTLLSFFGSFIDGVAALRGRTVVSEGWCMAACSGIGDPVETLDGTALTHVSGGPTVTHLIASSAALYGANGASVIQLQPATGVWQRAAVPVAGRVQALAVSAGALIVGTDQGLSRVRLPLPAQLASAAHMSGRVPINGLPSESFVARGFAPNESVMVQAYTQAGIPQDSSLAHAQADGTVVATLPIPLLAATDPYTIMLTGQQSGAHAVLLTEQSGAPLRALAAQPPVWAALQRLNYWRAVAGAPALALDPRLQQDSDLDALYMDRNKDTPACQNICEHMQVSGLPGYTGTWPADRCAAALYPWLCGAEVIGEDVSASHLVDRLVATVFHRTVILDPHAQFAGIGSVTAYGHSYVPMDFGDGPYPPAIPRWWSFPVPNQRHVPTVLGAEVPDPLLGQGTPGPHGDPITISFGARDDDVAGMTLHRLQAGTPGSSIPLYFFNAHNSVWKGTAWAISHQPLCPNTTYRVQAILRQDGASVPAQWDFTTGAADPAQQGVPCA